MLLVLLERHVVRASTQDLCQLTSRRPAQEIHLPQTIAGRHITLREIQVIVVGRFDVGDAAFVAPDGDAAVQTRQAETLSGLLRDRAGIG